MEELTKFYSLYPTRGIKCDGCNLGKDSYSDGFRCWNSGLFFHKDCAESPVEIDNHYHPQHSLEINVVPPENEDVHGECKLCRGNLPEMYYCCHICDFAIDLVCARKEVITTIEAPKTHEHGLSLLPELIRFTCHICGSLDDRFPYVCKLCGLSFHKVCAESPPEIDYSCHPQHPLKFLTRVPSYSNGQCSLCGNKLHNVFYHCAICNFSVDVNCANSPPPFTLDHPKAHQHPLILMPQRSFVCNVCGMDDDPNPYVCPQCNFMLHRNCVDVPRVIKIHRHDHLLHYNHRLKAGEWKCKVCHKEINWTCGAYSCSECSDFGIHMRCATRFGIWDGIEREGMSEDTSEIKSYEVIEEGVIRHFSHMEHGLKLKVESDANDSGMLCKACSYPVFTSPFYTCMECDDFILHQKCAHLPKTKIDSIYKLPMTLLPTTDLLICGACETISEGFWYKGTKYDLNLDVRCGSICEPFVHESHPLHSLYVNFSTENKVCNACGEKVAILLRCEECDFCLDIKCSILPKMVKHQNDKDHFLSLCYGEKTSKQYWCDICEEEVNSEKLFYSCDHCGITFHIKCTLGDFIWMKPVGEAAGSSSVYYAIPNNRVTRLICDYCKSRCQFPSALKHYKSTLCSMICVSKYEMNKY